jgi:hypothetical protein
MIPAAIAAFIGCFAAMVVLAEITAANKLIRYLAALVVGVLATVALAWAVQWIAAAFSHAVAH